MRDISTVSSGLPESDDQLERARPKGYMNIGDIVFDQDRGILIKDNKSVRIGPVLERFFRTLNNYPGQVLSHDQIHQIVWGQYSRGEGTLRQYIQKCRKIMKQLGSKSTIILHKHRGWEFIPPQS